MAPLVVVTDPSGLQLTLSLDDFFLMQRQARAYMAQALGPDREAAQAARQAIEQVFQTALAPGSGRLGATLCAYLLREELDLITEWKKTQASRTQVVDSPVEAPTEQTAVGGQPPVAQPCPADHPPDVACDLCQAERAQARGARQKPARARSGR